MGVIFYQQLCLAYHFDNLEKKIKVQTFPMMKGTTVAFRYVLLFTEKGRNEKG